MAEVNFWVGKNTVQYKGGCIAVDSLGNVWRFADGKVPVTLVDKDCTSPDANVESVRTMLAERSRVGLAKYGVTTERDDLSVAEWLRHLQEELLDAAVYIEALRGKGE